MMIQLGSITLSTNIVFAPLSGCSDLAFRLIAREHGAKLCFFEMIDAHSLLCNNPKKFDLVKTVEQDTPIAAQLLGADPAIMLEAAHILLEHVPKVSFLDVNSACPVKKVIKKNAGAALLNAPATLSQMIKTLASSLPVPITVKLRIGYARTTLPELIDLVKLCETSGAAALFVHGRTRTQGYSGEVNYAAIRAIKHAVTIPVFGSGNIFSPQLAAYMFKETDCDGVLVARGAFGYPWIFQDIEQYLQHGVLPTERTWTMKREVLKKHLVYVAQEKDCSPSGKIGFMRKVTLWYLKGFAGASHVRGQVCRIPDYEALLQFIETIEG